MADLRESEDDSVNDEDVGMSEEVYNTTDVRMISKKRKIFVVSTKKVTTWHDL